MNTKSVIEGLTIIQKYRNTSGGYDISAEHDMIYAHPTDFPVDGDEVVRLVKLGWYQDDAEYDYEEGFGVDDYDPEESWTCRV